MKSKIYRIIKIMCIAIIIIFINTSNAQASWLFEPDGSGYFATTTHNSETIFCGQMGGHLGSNTLLNSLEEGDTQGDFCSKCEGDPPEVSTKGGDVAYTYEYESYEDINVYGTGTLKTDNHQDVAYALATSSDTEKIQTVIWKTDLNKSGAKTWDAIKGAHNPSYDDDGLYEESFAYRQFYEKLQADGGFITRDATDYSQVKTSVNRADRTYTVGKYKIDYSNGIYTRKNGELVYFGYISSMKLKDQNGNELQILDLIDSSGASIMARQYPMPMNNEEFYVKFAYDGTGTASEVYLDIEFTYLEKCEAVMRYWKGHKYEWKWGKQSSGEDDHHHGCHWVDGDDDDDGYTCHHTYTAKEWILKKGPSSDIQILLGVDDIDGGEYWARKVWQKAYLTTQANPVDITMDLEGFVFLDVASGKSTVNASDHNGIYESSVDSLMANVEVTIYEEGGTVLATLYQKAGELRTNATLTDSDGHFTFKGLDAQKRYYVTYKFNGQKYENTTYKVAIADYNTGSWEVTSKASILDSDRLAYNQKFEEIHSSPSNYTNINNITGFNLSSNKTYKIYEQTYSKGQNEYQEMVRLENAINDKIKQFMNNNKRYPNSDSEKRSIYQSVANENSGISEVRNKIQYLVDMEVIAKTGYKSTMQYYPVYEQFVIDTVDRQIGPITYKALYNGQRFINLGLIEREKLDLTLLKDLEEVTIYINNKRYVYEYKSRQDEAMELELRGSDIADRVNSSNLYERELRESDIAYIQYLKNTGQDYTKRLRIFATYRIRVKNYTDGEITANITELRDHFDNCYTFNNSVNSSVITYDVLARPTVQETSENVYQLVKTAGEYLNWSGTTSGSPTNTITTTDSAMKKIDLKAGEYFDIYNMFEVKTEAIQDLLNTGESTKENYAQIAAYKSYYTKKRTYSDGDTINNAGYVAGLVDRDSRPGDFNANSSEVQDFVRKTYTDAYKSQGGEAKTQQSRAIFEDDADKAPGLNLKVLSEYRVLKGNVWEDKILSQQLQQNNIRQGDGENNDTQPIQNLRVQLIDMDRLNEAISQNADSFVTHTQYNTVTDIYHMTGNMTSGYFAQATTLTDANGNYEFDGYIPGNYLVRFIYGEQELLTTNNSGKVYEGQDYKSTLYTESDHQYGTDSSPTYWYDTTKSQKKSDAQDNLSRRNEINKNNEQINFHVSNVLNYYENKSSAYLSELENRSKLFADTEKLVLEAEYIQRNSDYAKDVANRVYVVENVDLGLVERPRQELTITKDIENIRIIANSGQTIFDTEQAVSNLAWIKPIKNKTGNYTINYDRNGLIQAIVDDNLMHGSTVKILYRITIENTGEKDYVLKNGNNITVDKTYYNTALPSPSATLATTNAMCVLDYVENNLKFSNELDAIDSPKKYNQYWELVKGEDNRGNGTNKINTVLTTGTDSLIDPSLKDIVAGYNTVIRTTSSSPLLKELLPADKRVTNDIKGETTSDTLLLTKVLDTSDNSDDSFVYDNGIEIVQTTNQTGRRHYNNKDKSKYNDEDQITKPQIITSIAGNYIPSNASDQNRSETTITSEPDSDYAERVTILVPFGEKNYTIIIISIVVGIVALGIGIILIKKKVLRK